MVRFLPAETVVFPFKETLPVPVESVLVPVCVKLPLVVILPVRVEVPSMVKLPFAETFPKLSRVEPVAL